MTDISNIVKDEDGVKGIGPLDETEFEIVTPLDNTQAGLVQAKGKLNGICIAAKQPLPEYSLVSQQRLVEKGMQMSAKVVQLKLYTGKVFYCEGNSQKIAERKAAMVALESLECQPTHHAVNPEHADKEECEQSPSSSMKTVPYKRNDHTEGQPQGACLQGPAWFLGRPAVVADVFSRDPDLSNPKKTLADLCRKCHVAAPDYGPPQKYYTSQIFLQTGESFTSDKMLSVKEAEDNAALKAIQAIELKIEESLVESIKRRRMTYSGRNSKQDTTVPTNSCAKETTIPPGSSQITPNTQNGGQTDPIMEVKSDSVCK